VIKIVNVEAHESAEHWERLAEEQEEWAKYEQQRDPLSSVQVFHNKAVLYRRSAQALRREAVTGKPHCTACMGAHANHEHGHRG
jgi:hypothetical protein